MFKVCVSFFLYFSKGKRLKNYGKLYYSSFFFLLLRCLGFSNFPLSYAMLNEVEME